MEQLILVISSLECSCS